MLLKENDEKPEKWAVDFRAKILSELRVPISIGIGPNKLVARYATTLAKPNSAGLARKTPGVFVLYSADDFRAHTEHVAVSELHGVGRITLQRLVTALPCPPSAAPHLSASSSSAAAAAAAAPAVPPTPTMGFLRRTCQESFLQQVAGEGLGHQLYHGLRGADVRPNAQVKLRPPESVSSQIGYGVRFASLPKALSFLTQQLLPRVYEKLEWVS